MFKVAKNIYHKIVNHWVLLTFITLVGLLAVFVWGMLTLVVALPILLYFKITQRKNKVTSKVAAKEVVKEVDKFSVAKTTQDHKLRDHFRQIYEKLVPGKYRVWRDSFYSSKIEPYFNIDYAKSKINEAKTWYHNLPKHKKILIVALAVLAVVTVVGAIAIAVVRHKRKVAREKEALEKIRKQTEELGEVAAAISTVATASSKAAKTFLELEGCMPNPYNYYQGRAELANSMIQPLRARRQYDIFQEASDLSLIKTAAQTMPPAEDARITNLRRYVIESTEKIIGDRKSLPLKLQDIENVTATILKALKGRGIITEYKTPVASISEKDTTKVVVEFAIAPVSPSDYISYTIAV